MPSCITCLARDYYLVSHLYYYSSKIHKKVRITLEQLGFRSQNDNCRGFFDPGTTYVLFPSSETQQIFRDTMSTLNSVGGVSRSPVAATCGQRVLSITSDFLGSAGSLGKEDHWFCKAIVYFHSYMFENIILQIR